MLPVILVLENIRSLHNIGAIFRSADGVALEGVLLAGLTAQPPRTEIEKTALGATKTVPWEYRADPTGYLRELQARGYGLAALEQTPLSTDLFQTPVDFPLVLVVGHEREGVTAQTLALCRQHLHLPMRGTSARSLNVATAASIALYEFRRRF